jgi:ribulose 1,5-bisphosphate synthetase/thiazole synthase
VGINNRINGVSAQNQCASTIIAHATEAGINAIHCVLVPDVKICNSSQKGSNTSWVPKNSFLCHLLPYELIIDNTIIFNHLRTFKVILAIQFTKRGMKKLWSGLIQLILLQI